MKAEIEGGLLVVRAGPTASLREISAADLIVDERSWLIVRRVLDQEVTKDGGLLDMKDEGKPSEPGVL